MLRARLRTLVLLLLACLGWPGPGHAEDPQARARTFILRDTNPARFAAEETRRLLAAGDLDRALGVAQGALDDLAGDLVLVEQRRESERWRPLAALIEEQLLALGPEGRARYDASVRAAAQPLLEQALTTGSTAALEQLDRRFGVSATGLEAARLLVETAVERGALREAALRARRALRAAPTDGALWLRLVDALADLGDAQGLAALKPPEGLSAATATGPVLVAQRLASARAALPPTAPTADRPMWGGRPSRDLAFPGPGAPALGLRWSAPTDLLLRERDVTRSWGMAENDEQSDFELHLAAYRPLFPALAGRLLLVSDGRTVRALDLLSGREVWRLNAGPTPLALLARGVQGNGRSALDRPFAPTVWRDRVVATLEVERPYVPDMLMNIEISTYMPRRVLVAAELETGRLAWAAGSDAAEASPLAGVSFVGEPVVAEDLVLAVGARHKQMFGVSLFAFDVRSGRLRYETPLAYGHQETNLFGNPVKEFSTGAVAAEGGVAYCQTGLGCVAAVEVQTGTVRWIASYDIQPLQRPESWYRAPLRIPRVGPVAPIVSGGVVVFAPGDGMHLLALDPERGSFRWRASTAALLETPFGSLAQVLGVTRLDGRDVLVATGGRVVALDLATGALKAAQALDPASSRVVGQGAIVGRHVLVPTEDGVQRFALDARLEPVGREPWPEGSRPGNLLPAGRVLVVAAQDRLQGHYAWADLEQEIERRRRAEPRNAEVLLEAGDLYLRGRGPDAARAAFEAALALAGRGTALERRARQGLFTTAMTEGRLAADRDGEAAVRAWRRALEHAQTAAERVQARLSIDGALPPTGVARLENLERLYVEAEDERAAFEGEAEALPVRPLVLLRIARLESEAGRPKGAVAALQRLLREQGPVLVGAQTARDLAQERIAALIREHGAAAYAGEEAQARALLAAADAAGDAAPLVRVLEEFPNASVVPAALRSLAAQRLAGGRPREAAGLLRRLLGRYRDAPESLSALALLAEASARQGTPGARRAALLALSERLGEATLETEVGAFTATSAREAARAGTAPGGRHVQPPLVARLTRPRPDEEVAVPVAVEADADDPSPVALVNAGGTLEAYALREPRLAFTVAERRAQHAAFALGTLVLSAPGELLGLSPQDGTVRWRRARSEQVMDLAVSRGQVVAWLNEPQPGRPLRRLEALDPATGETLWSATLGNEQIHSLRADGGLLLLQRARYEEGEARAWLLVYDGLTGALLQERRLAPTRDLMLLEGGLGLEVRLAAGGQRTVVAFDLERSRTRFTRPLDGLDPVTAAVRDGERVWLLRQDGRLEALALSDGAPLASTRLTLPREARAAPAHGTRAHVRDGRLVLLASPIRGGPMLLAFHLATGKAAWASAPQPFRRTDVHVLVPEGEHWLVLRAGQRPDGERALDLSVVRDADGEVEQALAPEPGPNGSVTTLTAGEGCALVVTGAGVVLYGPAAPEAR